MTESRETDESSSRIPSRGGRVRFIVAAAAAAALAAWFFLRPAPSPGPGEGGAAPAASRVVIAAFSRIDGSVKVKPVGSVEWSNASLSTNLSHNDLVRTAAGASADIAFKVDGSVLQVRADSLITIEGTLQDPATKRLRNAARISSGEVNVSTQANTDETSAVVSTPTARNYVAGETNAAIRVAQAGESDIRVFKGRSDVETNKGKKVRLTSQEGLRIDASGEAGDKVALPGTPELLSPTDATDLTYEDPAKAPTVLRWKGRTEAVAYRVVVDSSAYFNDPVFDKANVKDVQTRAQALGTGPFFWRVAAVGAEGLEGSFSDFARFSIARGREQSATPPPLAVETLERRGNIVLIKGRTERGAHVTVNGSPVEVRPDGSFSEHLPLEQDQITFTVRAISPSGGITEQRRNLPRLN